MPEVCTDEAAGKTVVITGATSGIGYATARKFAAHGANLLCVNRNEEKSEALRKEIEAEFSTTCEYMIGDMSSLKDVHRIGHELSQRKHPIDILIHNAGVYITKREETSDGLEKVMVVNHLSSFVLTYLLMDKLKAQDRARIILVNSEGHRFAAWGLHTDDLNWERRHYTGMRSYGAAKTAQLLSMLVFNELFDGSGVTINAMHPGAVKTHTGKENGRLYQWYKRNFVEKNTRSPELSAEALYYLGISEKIEGRGGKFFSFTTEEEPAPPALDRETAQELWELSLEMGGLSEHPIT